MANNEEGLFKNNEEGLFKVVIIGDGAVGKTCLLHRFVNNSFCKDYCPTVFDNLGAEVNVKGKKVDLGLWDTAGQEEFDNLRHLSYPETDVFLVAFSIGNKASFAHAKSWHNDITEYLAHESKKVFVFLIGLKSDQRSVLTKHQVITTH